MHHTASISVQWKVKGLFFSRAFTDPYHTIPNFPDTVDWIIHPDGFQEGTELPPAMESHIYPLAIIYLCLPMVLSIHTPPVGSATKTSPAQSSWLLQPCRRLSAGVLVSFCSDRSFPWEMSAIRFSVNIIVVSVAVSLNCSWTFSDVVELHWPISLIYICKNP